MDAQHIYGDTQQLRDGDILETEPQHCALNNPTDGLARLSFDASLLSPGSPRIPNGFAKRDASKVCKDIESCSASVKKPPCFRRLFNDSVDDLDTDFFDARLGHLLNDSADDLAQKLLDVKSCIWREIQRLDEIADVFHYSGHCEPGAVPEVPVTASFSISRTPHSQISSGYNQEQIVEHAIYEPSSELSSPSCNHDTNPPFPSAYEFNSSADQNGGKVDGASSLFLSSSLHAYNQALHLNSDPNADTPTAAGKASPQQVSKPLKSTKVLTNVARILSDEDTWNDVTENTTYARRERRSFQQHYERMVKHKSVVLETFMGFVILSNAISIGVSCELGSAFFWMLVDTVYAVIYLLESILKLAWGGCTTFFMGDDRSWNIFEVALVLLAWVELTLNVMWSFEVVGQNESEGSWVMLMFVRIFKLARVLRLVRVLRLDIFSELMAMATGATGTMRTWFWSCVMIFFPLYLASLIFRQTLGEASSPYFRTLPMSFFTLFRCLVPGECTDEKGRPIFHLITKTHGSGFGMAYILLVMFMTFGLFNVIVAIYVENVVVASKSDNERVKKQRLRNQQFFNRKMVELFTIMWELHVDLSWEKGIRIPVQHFGRATAKSRMQYRLEQLESLEITEELFGRFIHDKRTKEIFQDLEVADDDQANMFAMLDVDGSGTIEIEELYDGISKLRGPARRSDVVSSQMLLGKVLQELAKYAEQAGEKAGGSGNNVNNPSSPPLSTRLKQISRGSFQAYSCFGSGPTNSMTANPSKKKSSR